MLRNKEFWLRAALLVGSLAFSLLLAEAIVRFLSPQRLPGSIIESDLLLGYLYKKNVRTRFFSRFQFISMRTNSLGLRQDEEIAEKKLPGEIRVLFLGGSFVFGWGVQVEENLVSLLREKAKKQFPDANFTFINAGHGGWGTQQTLAYLERDGFNLHPDYVINFIGLNDLENNDEVPLYQLLSSGKLSEDPEPPRYWKNRSFIQNYFPLYDWFLYNSLLVQLARAPLRSSWNLWRHRHPRHLAQQAAIGGEPAESEEKLTRALFLRMAADVQNFGAMFSVSSVGTANPRTSDFLQDEAPVFFHEKGIDFIDVSRAMETKVERSPVSLFLKRDPHYNPAGYQILADLLWPSFRTRLDKLRKLNGISAIAPVYKQ